MKKAILFSLFSVFAILSCAQIKHSNIVSITYRHLYQGCEEIPKLSEVLCVLDIEDGKSHFYSKDFERGIDLSDSLSKKGFSASEIVEAKKKEGLSGAGCGTNVFKNYPEEGKISVTEKMAATFIYEEAMPDFNWNLEEGDTIIAGYACYKASTTYRGRTWTVFYAPDLPVSEGPWKLCGLPGLILFAADSQGKFIYDCIGISSTLQRSMQPRKDRMQKCDAKEMADLLTLQFKDMDEFMFRMSGTRIKHLNTDGRPSTLDMSITVCLKEMP